jgi:hypothetical protein
LHIGLDLRAHKNLLIDRFIYGARLLSLVREVGTKKNSLDLITSCVTSQELIAGVEHVNLWILEVNCKEKPVP